jgi:nucleotide-binding universal stress UspA family protein
MANEQRVILSGWDGSERARDALALAAVLARLDRAAVRAVTSYKSRSSFAQHFGPPDGPREHAEALLADLPRDMTEGLDLSTAAIPVASPSEALTHEADAAGADVVVLGSTHRGTLNRVFLGTVALDLLHESSCGVAVAPAGYADQRAEPIRRVLVAYDGTRASKDALERGTSIARNAGATLEVVTVVDTAQYSWVGPEMAMSDPTLGPTGGAYLDPQLVELERDAARRHGHELLDGLRSDAVSERRMIEGDPAEALVEASTTADLLVMGSRAQSTATRALVGSTSARLVRASHCPVWVVPEGRGG